MTIAASINNQNLLRFSYDGYRRTVEPHTYGVDRKGHMALRAYQVGGGSESREYVGWKTFQVHDMLGVSVLQQTFLGPRPEYRLGDRAFTSIRAQL